MSPLLSRRRARRRSITRRIAAALLAALVLTLLIGGLVQVSHESGRFHQITNASLAAQGTVVATESTASGAELRQVMASLATVSRPALEADLDNLVTSTAQQLVLAERAAPSGPNGSLANQFRSVFVERAQASVNLRAALDGLLSMHPLTVAGAPGGTVIPATPTVLTAVQATSRIAAVGSTLQSADATYRSVRSALARAPGHARVPASAWVRRARLWNLGSVAEEVDLATGSVALAPTHNVELRTVRLDPPALPTPTNVAGTSTLSPTNSVTVTVVVANLGSVDAPDARVQFALEQVGSGTTVTRIRHTEVVSDGAVTLPAVTFSVKPGQDYQLAVAILLPPGQTSTANTSVSQVLDIAPGT